MATVNDPGDRKRVRTGTRNAGLRRAREAKQLRDARRRERERALEEALVDYYTWIALAEDIREKARKRAGRVLAEAEDAVQMPLVQAGNALRRLRDLGETREAIRELTQISTSRLREILAHAPRPRDGESAAARARGGRSAEDIDGDVETGSDPGSGSETRERYDDKASRPTRAGRPGRESDREGTDDVPGERE